MLRIKQVCAIIGFACSLVSAATPAVPVATNRSAITFEQLQEIAPDADIQTQLNKLNIAAASVTGEAAQEAALLPGLQKMRPWVRQNPVSFVRQLMYFGIHAESLGSFRLLIIQVLLHRFELDHQGDTLLMAVVPYLDSSDPDVKDSIIVVQTYVKLSDFQNVVRQLSQGTASPPPSLVAAMMRQWPGPALESMALARIEADSFKPIMMAGHSIQDYDWKKQHGFDNGQKDADLAIEQLKLLAGQKEYWARLYVCQILKGHKELRNPDLLGQLQGDENERVKKAAQEIK